MNNRAATKQKQQCAPLSFTKNQPNQVLLVWDFNHKTYSFIQFHSDKVLWVSPNTDKVHIAGKVHV